MDSSLYWLGVLFAISSGVANSFGVVMQKKVVNDLASDPSFTKSLIKNRLWLLGFLLQLAVGSVLFILAQIFIGPALVPGLMAAGLIVLAIGSVKLIGETLKKSEIIGIVFMILAITLLGLSQFSIDIATVDMLDTSFILRVVIFTVLLFALSAVCEVAALKFEKNKGVLISISSGFMFAISNFWISPLMGVIVRVFEGESNWGELIWFISASIMLPLVNLIGTFRLQSAFKSGQASNLVPIQQVPIQIAPIFVYFLVFLLLAPNFLSTFFMLVGVAFILISSFILGKRKAQMDKIKK